MLLGATGLKIQLEGARALEQRIPGQLQIRGTELAFLLVERLEEPVDDEGLKLQQLDIVCASAWTFDLEIEPPDEELGESKRDRPFLLGELGQDFADEPA